MKLFSRNPAKGLMVLDCMWCSEGLQVRVGRTRVMWFKYLEVPPVPFRAWTESKCWSSSGGSLGLSTNGARPGCISMDAFLAKPQSRGRSSRRQQRNVRRTRLKPQTTLRAITDMEDFQIMYSLNSNKQNTPTLTAC